MLRIPTSEKGWEFGLLISTRTILLPWANFWGWVRPKIHVYMSHQNINFQLGHKAPKNWAGNLKVNPYLPTLYLPYNGDLWSSDLLPSLYFCRIVVCNFILLSYFVWCRSIIKFAEQSLNPEMRASFFSPRLMEVVCQNFCSIKIFNMISYITCNVSLIAQHSQSCHILLHTPTILKYMWSIISL